MNLMQQLTHELQDATKFVSELQAQLAASQKCEQALCQLVRDYHQFVSELHPRYGYGAIRHEEKEDLQKRAKELLEEGAPTVKLEEVEDAALKLLATLPESYPPSTFGRDPEGLYSLMVGGTIIFHSKPAADALARVTRYVKERENSPTLPVGVIDGIYD